MILLALGFCKGFFYLVVQSVLDDLVQANLLISRWQGAGIKVTILFRLHPLKRLCGMTSVLPRCNPGMESISGLTF